MQKIRFFFWALKHHHSEWAFDNETGEIVCTGCGSHFKWRIRRKTNG